MSELSIRYPPLIYLYLHIHCCVLDAGVFSCSVILQLVETDLLSGNDPGPDTPQHLRPVVSLLLHAKV